MATGFWSLHVRLASRRPASVSNARHAARRRAGTRPRDPLLHFCDGHVACLRHQVAGPGSLALAPLPVARRALTPPGAGASRAPGTRRRCRPAPPSRPDARRRRGPETWRPRLAARHAMTELEFKSLALQGFNRIPLIAEAFADLETPLSLYLKLAGGAAGAAAAATASCSNRWSAASASAAIRSSACRRARCCARPAFAPRSSPTARSSRPTTAIRSTSSPPTSSASRSRCGRGCRASAAAWPATSATTRCATSSRAWPRRTRRGRAGPIDTPDILLLQCEELAVIDNLSGRLYLIVYADPGVPEAFATARRRLLELTDKLRASVTAPPVERGAAEPVRREFAKDDYLAAVRAPRSTSPPAT